MGNFLNTTAINKIMGWRNYATTQQPAAFFPNGNPSFPPAPDYPPATPNPTKDLFAKNFLGAAYPLATSFTTVSTAVQNNRTDQAAMTRQQLIKLQRTLDNPPGQFPQSLLQYLGTFSRENNRPAQDWPLKNGNRLSTRFDMTNLQIVIPGFRIRPGNNGIGHAWGLQKKALICKLFGLSWVDGTFDPLKRFTDPNYYGHWQYNVSPGCRHDINSFPADPDFFQIINYATNEAVGVNDPNRIRNTFMIGAALIDMYDGDDLNDPDPNNLGDGSTGNTITIIDYGGASYAYGIEAMSYDDPNFNLQRPPLAPPSPWPPLDYVLLNRRFENVGEFGYAYNPARTTGSRTLDFASATSKDRAILDFFTYNEASPRAGIVNLNTRNVPVLASVINGALLNDPGAERAPTNLVSRDDGVGVCPCALAAAKAIVQETTNTAAGHGPALTRADVARLAEKAGAAVPALAASDETKQTIARALSDTGQARTWNLMIDVIAQTGKYKPNAPDFSASNFIVQGEKRYWLHVALDRDSGTVLGTQLEEVFE
jgi:hypothetical protein